ncbi:hypothetical protein O6H91_17G047600 [Diphasiastrum complanatum]|uniref:Uncharacterized protein n=1 Tax=Diphasiastrum complanatum TaxID=34168 RepID=A0ACC2B7G5_DIPCM|nr:hypothetical protein O6H91_17G047600 [Diphasiastrum complanatum]
MNIGFLRSALCSFRRWLCYTGEQRAKVLKVFRFLFESHIKRLTIFNGLAQQNCNPYFTFFFNKNRITFLKGLVRVTAFSQALTRHNRLPCMLRLTIIRTRLLLSWICTCTSYSNHS